jgi:hypothetical protein
MWYDKYSQHKYFQPMQQLLKPGETEHFALEHFTVTEKEADHFTMVQAIHGRDGINPGNYVRLIDKRTSFRDIIMSDTGMEKYSNLDFVEKAHGNVLIGGLGIGMVLAALLKKPEVTSITVVEKELEIIELVGKQDVFQDGKIRIIEGDIFQFETDEKFNTIYFDIWSNICTDNWEGMKLLKRKFRRNLNKQDENRWIGCWKWDEVQWRVRDDKKRGW